ncbi:MAG: glycosyltransferase family 4 protein [Chlorobi bacterium]|nr:glycosyltransferase family 4 protein [Chlorobiota bacterium]
MSDKVKILYISHSPYYNGAELSLFNLVKHINWELYEPVVIFPYEGPLVNEMKSQNIKIYITPLERWIRYIFDEPVKNTSLFERIQKIIEVIEKENIDIVHSNTSVIFEGAVAANIKKIPHIWHVHEFLKENRELHPCLPLRNIFDMMSILSKKIVCVSNYNKEQFKVIDDKRKLVTIYNGVSESKNSENCGILKKKLNITDEELISVTVGFLTKNKGYPDLLNAVALVRKEIDNMRFFWVGASLKSDLREFKYFKKKLDLKDIVNYLGFRRDVSGILNCSDLLICSSLNEAFPLVILEAMSAGLPIITTNWGGASECVINNVTGFIVPVGDSGKLSEKIIELARNNTKRKLMGENARKHFRDNFNLKKFVEQFEKLYSVVLNNMSTITLSINENNILNTFLNTYEEISDNHWKNLKKEKK